MSTAGQESVTRGYLKDEAVSVKPEVGVLAFTDETGSSTSRMAYGLGLDWNLTSLVSQYRDLYVGISTGLIFSHLGQPTSNFVGTSPTDTSMGGDPGSNIALIPANLKVGYAIWDNFRLSAHGGGNVLYRSVASSLNLGSSSGSSGSVWRIFPNAGADLEVGFGKTIALLVRPDWTFTPGDTFFTGMVGLDITFG